MRHLTHLSILGTSLLSACAATGVSREPVQDPSGSTEALAHGLVREAELRTDMRAVRVLVDEIQAKDAAPRARDPLAEELGSDLVLALSDELHVLDDRLGSASTPRPGEGDLTPLASSGITHIVFGEYARRGDDVLFSARLVDTRTRLIVAAQRVAIPLESLSARAQETPETVAWVPTLVPAPGSTGADAIPDAAVEVAALETYPRTPEAPGTAEAEQVEDFDTWLARQPVSQEEVEDFEAWRARQPEKQAKIVDFDTWLAQRDEAAAAESVGGEATALVDPNAPSPSAAPAEATALRPLNVYREASHSVQPWRTQALRELLGIPGP